MVVIRLCSSHLKFLEMFFMCVSGRANKSHERKVNLQVIKIDCFSESVLWLCVVLAVWIFLCGREVVCIGRCSESLSSMVAVSPVYLFRLNYEFDTFKNQIKLEAQFFPLAISVVPSHHPGWLEATTLHLLIHISNTRVCWCHCLERTQAYSRDGPTNHGVAQTRGFMQSCSLPIFACM